MSMQQNPTPPESHSDQDLEIQGHNYDGITEYDNPMPGWWVWLFWASVAFTPIYVLGVHQMGFINSYEDDLAESLEDLEQIRSTYAAENETFEADETALIAYAGDPNQITAGQGIYTQNCLACHGDAGQGIIGPNLTDAYWIHGPTLVDMYNVVTNGVIEKGMTPWDSILSPEQRGQVVAFIYSLQGSNPPNAKEPQGELYE